MKECGGCLKGEWVLYAQDQIAWRDLEDDMDEERQPEEPASASRQIKHEGKCLNVFLASGPLANV